MSMLLRASTTDRSANAKIDKLATSWKAALKRERALTQWRYLKRWPKHDKVFVDLRFFQTREAILLKDVDVLDNFFVDFESSRPPCDYDVVRKFFRTYRPVDASSGLPQAWAKLDARDFAQKTKRAYSQWLTPADLYGSLTVKRFETEQQQVENQLDIKVSEVAGELETQTGLENQLLSQAETPEVDQVSEALFSNADRQIIYIYKLSPQYILTLLRTAYYHQQSALRDAICKHIAGEALVRVRAPINGFTTFHLDFHMPFLTLRDTNNLQECCNDTSLEIASLSMYCEEHKKTCRYVIRKSHISIVVCGWSHSKWVCWAFSNTDEDPTTRNEDPAEEFDLQEDHVATDGNGPEDGRVTDLNQPIWCARSYWLSVIDTRMRIIHTEWTCLVKSVKADVDAWVNEPCFKTTHHKDLQIAQRESLGELLDRAFEKTELVRKLNDNLGNLIRAWRRFEKDTNYFSDLQERQLLPAVTSFGQILDSLIDLKRTLSALEKSCEKAEKRIGRFMSTIGIKINAESYDIGRRSHAINLLTNNISQQTARLNRQSTAAAVESSRTTRINVQMFLITTPFILALQYFGAEKDIFSFDRNPRTFSYTICVLFCVLPLLTYGLGLLNQSWDTLMRKMVGKTKDMNEEMEGYLAPV